MTPYRFALLQWSVIIIVLGGLLYLLSPIFTPFVAAAILAYICDPAVSRLCAWKLPRVLATLLVMLALFGLLILLVLIMLPLLTEETQRLITRLPQWLDAIQHKLLPYLQQRFGLSLQWDTTVVKNFLMSHSQSAAGAAATVLPWLGDSSSALLTMLMNLVLIPVALFYLLRDWPLLLAHIEQIIPRRSHAKVLEISREVDSVLAEFLRGQVATMLLMSVFYAVALSLVGLQFALPIGILAGMLVFVPYLGVVIGLFF